VKGTRPLCKGLFYTLTAALLLLGSSHFYRQLSRDNFRMNDTAAGIPIQRADTSFDSLNSPTGGFSALPHIGLCIKPHTISLGSEGKLVISMIGLPEALDPHDIDSDSIELSVLSCPSCGSLHPTRQYPFHGNYITYFSRQELIEKFKTMGVDAPIRIHLKLYGELNDGTPFEGLETVWVDNLKSAK
jgi:hypothetical protein